MFNSPFFIIPNIYSIYTNLSPYYMSIPILNEEVGRYLIDIDGTVIHLDDGSEYVNYWMVLKAGGPDFGKREVRYSNWFNLKSNQTVFYDQIGPMFFCLTPF